MSSQDSSDNEWRISADLVIIDGLTPSYRSGVLDEQQECIDLFKDIQDTGNIDELINMIEKLRDRLKSKQQNRAGNASTSSQRTKENEEESGRWAPIIKKGSQFLEWLNEFGPSEKLNQRIKVVLPQVGQIRSTLMGLYIIGFVLSKYKEMLLQLGQIRSTLAGLCIIGFVLSKYKEMQDNKPKCLQMLGHLIDLARHLQRLQETIPAEKLKEVTHFIVQGSITCLCLLEDNTLFSFMKSLVNSENLRDLQKRINELYSDLMSTVLLDMRKDIPTHLPIR